MNNESDGSAASARIDLAHEPDFMIGSLSVRPSSCSVEGDNWRMTVEPRVMQVLVMLARAEGTVVSRPDMIRCCWAGRIVGEDAINHCIAKVRRLAKADSNRSFSVETVRRVGYRLVQTAPRTDPPEATKPAHAKSPGRRLRLYLVAVALLAAALAGIGLHWWFAPG